MECPKVSFQDFANICRICLSKEEFSKPFIHLFGIFKVITNIEIQPEDHLPRNICQKCSTTLEQISSFVDQSKRSDLYLNEIYNKHKLDLSLLNNASKSDTDDSIEFCNDHETDPDASSSDEGTSEAEKTKASDVIIQKEKLVATRHSTKRQVSFCNICGEKFSSKGKLIEHQKKNITCKTKPFNCTICDKAFFTKFKLSMHMRSHTKEMPFECKICSKKFRFATNVRRHENVIHKGLKPFKCETCGKEFARLERKIHHMSIHTGKQPYTCGKCGNSFRHRSSFQDHIVWHKIKNGEMKNLSGNQCLICEKIFFSKYRLQSHMQTHNGDKKFLCFVCGKDFLKQHNLDIHFRMHTEETPFHCTVCGKKFKYASGYRAHISIHTGERAYKCDICSKSLKQTSHLKSHKKTHTGEKMFECSFCEKRFANNSNLKAHIRIHTGETPYHCAVCDKAFHDSSNMKAHEKRHKLQT